MTDSKKWYKSKTIWVNVLAIAGGIFTAISGEMTVGSTLTIAGVINIVLRVITNTKVN